MLNHEPVHLFPTHYVNGLVCFLDHIWNPATNQSICIPFLNLYAFYPSTSEPCSKYATSSRILFGYDDYGNAYKVLQLCFVKDIDDVQYPPRCKVWTVGTSAWRDFDISNIPSDFSHLEELRSCAISGVIYCLGGVGHTHWSIGPREWKIFAFDVRHEKLTDILSLPVSEFRTRSSVAWSLINVRGHLGLVHNTMTTIFVLGKHGYWLKEKLLLPHEWHVWSPKTGSLNFHDPVKEGFMLVGSVPTGEVLFQLTDLDQESKKITTYFCYDLVTKKTSKFLDLTGLLGRLTPRVLLLSYAESVFRLHATKLPRKIAKHQLINRYQASAARDLSFILKLRTIVSVLFVKLIIFHVG